MTTPRGGADLPHRGSESLQLAPGLRARRRARGEEAAAALLGYKLTDRLLKLPGLEKLTREQRMAFASVNHSASIPTATPWRLLDGTGISCPPIESYLDKLIDYAQKARKKET